jgi:hypothetical protein
VPTLDRAAIELGGDGFALPMGGGGAPLGLIGALGTPWEVGGVARLPRAEKVGEKGGSVFWYWLIPDQSLPSTDTGDMAPECPPFITDRGDLRCLYPLTRAVERAVPPTASTFFHHAKSPVCSFLHRFGST